MKKTLILILVFITTLFNTACTNNNNGGSTSNTPPQPKDNSHLIDPVSDGNGVMNYSVATDYFYGQNSTPSNIPSLEYDLSQYTTTAIQYVFPVFGYLNVDNSKGTPIFSNPSSYSITCSPTAPVVFNYYANPQVSNNAVSGVGNYLGNCVNGKTATSYYQSFLRFVVPVVEYDAAFLAALSSPTTTINTVLAIADNIASVINNDPNAYGVAFDNEPAINAIDPSYGETYEMAFFGEIATKLAEHKKYLFLFDANYTGIQLYKNGYKNVSLNNIILLQPLYDLEDTKNKPPSGPLDLSTYTTDATNQVISDLSDPTAPPLMFVLPASATTTMWSYLQGYDMVPAGKSYPNPTSLNNPAACQTTNATTSGTIDNGVLGLLLCSASGCVPSDPAANISSFLNAQNCVNYNNSTTMDQYFSQVLNIVKNNTSINNPRYLGSTLYAWRISAFNDIACGVHYYSQYGDSSLYKICTQQFPAEISPTIWTLFNTWGWPN